MHTCCIPNPVRIPLLNRDNSITRRSNPTFLPSRRLFGDDRTTLRLCTKLRGTGHLFFKRRSTRFNSTILLLDGERILREVENLRQEKQRIRNFPFSTSPLSRSSAVLGRVAGKYTLNKICIIIPREEEFYLPRKGPPLHARQPRPVARGHATMRVINARYAAARKKRLGKEYTTT